MNRSSIGNGTFAKHIQIQRNWLYDAEPYARTGPRSFDDVAADLKLRSVLKRAVAKTNAPSYLIEAIGKEIRK